MKQYFSFQWHITDECDQRCRHCYIFSEDNGKKLDAMTWAQIEDTFYNCLDFCEMYNRQPYFYITGGDPILHPDFWKLLSLMKEHEIPFTILGNPFHLNDAVCRKLKEYGCQKYQLSLDGMRETHDWFRKPGSFDATLEKISCIKNAGIRSVVMTTVSGTNIEEIPDIIDTVVARKADVFAFARYCPTSDEKDTGIEPMRYRRLLADCDKKFKEYERKGCETYFNKKDHLWTLYEYETGAFRIPETIEEGMIYGGCNCGNCHLTILPTGDIFACRRARNSKVGNESGRKKIFLIKRLLGEQPDLFIRESVFKNIFWILRKSIIFTICIREAFIPIVCWRSIGPIGAVISISTGIWTRRSRYMAGFFSL